MDSNNPNDEAIREGDPSFRGTDRCDAERGSASGKPPIDADRQKRARQRLYVALYAVGVGLMFIFMFDGYLLNGLVPMPWVGWFLIGLAVLGLMGVNVFSGGPLDYRLDDVPLPPDRKEGK